MLLTRASKTAKLFHFVKYHSPKQDTSWYLLLMATLVDVSEVSVSCGHVLVTGGAGFIGTHGMR